MPRPSRLLGVQAESPHSGAVRKCVAGMARNTSKKRCSRNSPARIASTTSPIATIREFVIVSLQVEVGRPGGTRTPNMRFWRPPLYHWSYWPTTRCLRPPAPSRPPAKPSASLLGLLVAGVLAAPRGELRLDQCVGHGALVLSGGGGPLLAHRGIEREDRTDHRIA